MLTTTKQTNQNNNPFVLNPVVYVMALVLCAKAATPHAPPRPPPPPASRLPAGIRDWGCGLSDTPFIFVHVGKCGGGGIRRLILRAGKNLTKERNPRKWTSHAKDTFYPLDAASTSTVPSAGRHARFFNSAFKNNRPPGFEIASGRFEGINVCPAATPLGFAFACHDFERAPRRGFKPSGTGPDPAAAYREVCGAGGGGSGDSGDKNGGDCDVVYVGHNFLGAEMTWLPWPWLSRWWRRHSTKLGLPNGIPVPGSRHACSQVYEKGSGNAFLNPNQYFGENRSNYYNSLLYTQCIMPATREADANAARAFSIGTDAAQAHSTSWAPLYASLPLLRVTMLREPFSYLISKYFWHSKQREDGMVCETGAGGWITEFSYNYLWYICGEDCVARGWPGMPELGNLGELETQASENLRHSFAVVGLLEKTDRFYEMVRKRVAYLQAFGLGVESLTNLSNPVGHKSAGSSAKKRCQEVLADPFRQAQLEKEYPVLSVLVRLYQVAVEVESHQYNELSACS